jgi:hypothetical protein
MALRVTWQQALAWRMQRQLIEPVGTLSTVGVVRRLCGVQTQVASTAELAIRLRRQSSRAGEVVRALSDGRLVKTWAMRGTLHLLAPEDAGAYLSLIAAGRSWETPAWERYFGMTEKHWKLFRPVVREALDGAVLTREELIAKITAHRGLRHVGDALRSGWGTLLKPLAWQGDLCFGPSRGNRVTFMRPERATSRWAGVPDPDDAAPRAIVAYFRAYAPATMDSFHNWLSRGRVSRRQLRSWFGAVGDRLVQIEVDGERAYVLAEDVDELASARPTKAVRLLPGFDAYVLGPGTEDPHVVPPKRRRAVSMQAGWIAPLVLAGGVVRGTWKLEDDEVRVAWFRESGTTPRHALQAEVARLSAIQGRELRLKVALA